MDKRRSRFTVEKLSELLGIDGDITHIETDHAYGIVDVFFHGDGTFEVGEGLEIPVRTPDQWRELKKE